MEDTAMPLSPVIVPHSAFMRHLGRRTKDEIAGLAQPPQMIDFTGACPPTAVEVAEPGWSRGRGISVRVRNKTPPHVYFGVGTTTKW
jgi:hypothetical protein